MASGHWAVLYWVLQQSSTQLISSELSGNSAWCCDELLVAVSSFAFLYIIWHRRSPKGVSVLFNRMLNPWPIWDHAGQFIQPASHLPRPSFSGAEEGNGLWSPWRGPWRKWELQVATTSPTPHLMISNLPWERWWTNSSGSASYRKICISWEPMELGTCNAACRCPAKLAQGSIGSRPGWIGSGQPGRGQPCRELELYDLYGAS